jgi:hypothetical protein
MQQVEEQASLYKTVRANDAIQLIAPEIAQQLVR